MKMAMLQIVVSDLSSLSLFFFFSGLLLATLENVCACPMGGCIRYVSVWK